MVVADIPQIAANLLGYCELEIYKRSFGWVDNIRRVKDEASIASLNESLLEAVKTRNRGIVLTMPEIIEWDSVLGFSFTRSKHELSPTIDTNKYLENVDPNSVSIESLRRDRLYITDMHDNEFGHSIYKCLYFELDDDDAKNVFFGGNWYEINNSFMRAIDATLDRIDLSGIQFPGVQTWVDDNKKMIEKEGDYNQRVAHDLRFHLLDKRLVKSSKTTSPIELCDLLTSEKQMIHVKHRKGPLCQES